MSGGVCLPALPLPPPMTGAAKDSWAYDTVTRRWPDIVARILEENDFNGETVRALRALSDEIPEAPIRDIDDDGGPDVSSWRAYLRPYVGKRWLTPPWFLMEHYFYRRVLEAVGYFRNRRGACRDSCRDPFGFQKREGLRVARDQIASLASAAQERLTLPVSERILAQLIDLDLWGNQADLSLWPAEDGDKPDHATAESAEFVLADDSTRASRHLLAISGNVAQVDVLVDNAGFELVGDLIVADYLLSTQSASTVRLHLKPHPTFVSDAMIKDVYGTLAFLESVDAAPVRAFAHRLREHDAANRLRFEDNYFWTSPLPAWEMPAVLRKSLGRSDLVISKGDAHYRRLLGDLDWRFTDSFEAILSYYPAPLLALRTLKSELCCGLAKGQERVIAQQDPDWLTNGRWGLIQFRGRTSDKKHDKS